VPLARGREEAPVSPYLRLLLLRTRRVFLTTVIGLPFVMPTAFFVAVVLQERRQSGGLRGTQVVDAFFVTAAAALLFAVLAVANLTAFLVHDERRDGRARVLRLATIDGRRPVAAHLCHASLLALAGVAVGLVVPGAYCVAAGLPLRLCLMLTLAAGAFATVSGVVGLWIGYLLPRLAAVIALQLACFWLTFRLATAVSDALQASRPPLVALAWLLAAHGFTLLVLSPLWRRTSARLW
jgi:hypothetical protein